MNFFKYAAIGSLLLFCLGCPGVDGTYENEQEADVFDHDVPEQDVREQNSPETIEIRLARQQHPVLPIGPMEALSWTIVTEETTTGFVGEGELLPGVITISLPGWEPASMHERTLRPLARTHTHSELEYSYFLVTEPTEVRVEVDESRVEVNRVNPEGVGKFFDEAIAALEQQEDSLDVLQTLQRALREDGGAPIDSADLGRFFVAIGSQDGVAPDLRGTFNNWEGGSAYEFQPLSGRLWGRFIRDIEGYHAYKITYGGGASWFTDFANPYIEWDGVEAEGLGAFNSVVEPAARPQERGRLIWWPEVYSPELDNTREVYVYLPPSYDEGESESDHPLLIIHDGNESITRGRFHQVADERGGDEILAFVALPDQNVRMAEYTMASEEARGPDYAAFVVETLLSKLISNFRISDVRRDRGLAGSSLGGLISFWIASQYPTEFGFAGGMSSSFFWADDHMLEVIEENGCQDISYYLDSGSPQDNYVVTLAMRDLLDELDCQYAHLVEEEGRHEWSYWQGRFGNVLDEFAR